MLTREEVRRVLSNIRVLHHRTCLTLICSFGLRDHLQLSQIDSERMVVHVLAGKGARGSLCSVATGYPPATAPPSEATRPLPISSVQKVFHQSLKEVGIQKDAYVHILRHSYAPHLPEAGG